MPLELPSKIWLQILEKYISAKPDLRSLSFTNKQIRGLILPILFQSLQFRGFPPNQDLMDQSEKSYESYLKALIPFYTRIRKRVDWLLKRPHLLPHVRTFHLRGWSQLAALLEEEPDIWYSPMYGDALDRWASAYDALTGLLVELPSLKVFAIAGSPITPKLQSAFYLTPALDSLMLSTCEIEVGRSTIPRHQVACRLQDLAYEPLRSNPEHLPSYFKQLLRRCLPALVSLKIPMDCIVEIEALVSAKRHSLRHLVISESPFGPIGTEKASAVYDLLKSCPELRTLKIIGWVDRDLPDLAAHAPPHLDYISGTSTLFQALVPGRPIHSVHLQYCPLDPITSSSFILSRPSTALVRKVFFDCGTALPSEIISALGGAFRHLNHLTIRFLRGYSANRAATIGELLHPIGTALPHLRVYHVVDPCSPRHSDIDRASTEHDVECPIACRGEPDDRGHPTLEELRLLSRFTWIWIDKEGWACREFGPNEI